MIITCSILVALATFSISEAVAGPVAFASTTAPSISQVSSESGFNVSITQDYVYDDSEVVPTIFLDGGLEASSLQKRDQTPDECWLWSEKYPGHSLPSHVDYEDSVASVIKYLKNTGLIATIPRGKRFSVSTDKTMVVVRNQSSCKDIKILYSTIAYYAEQVQYFCADETGWIARAGSLGQTVIIVQPVAELPPPYGAQCPA
ncbi:hypothetical protein LTR17_017309 [Elasticomyces elasticus]|nr:hypothetical protein LTR17_017309 [Elasticomyces elasticus]